MKKWQSILPSEPITNSIILKDFHNSLARDFYLRPTTNVTRALDFRVFLISISTLRLNTPQINKKNNAFIFRDKKLKISR